MVIDDEKFSRIRKYAEEEYAKIGVIRCPYLEDDVHFNRIGFEHLLFKEWNKTRSRVEQYTRLRLLKFAPDIIKRSHTLQEYDERRMFVRQRINARWESRMKTVRYYVFVAIVQKARIKVIVKEIEGAVKLFYSLYPSWRTEKNDGGMTRKVLYSGDLERD